MRLIRTSLITRHYQITNRMNILDCLSKMHTSFKDLKVFNRFPKVVEDLIFLYAYGLTRGTLHLKAVSVRSATYALPVPLAWKWFFDEDSCTFHWRRFLRDHTAEIIDDCAVMESLNLLNWNQLRSKQNAISNLVRTNTKVNLKRQLTMSNRRDNTIQMVWHLLTCASRSDYCARAFRNENVNRYLYIPYFNRPLTAYYPVSVGWTAWDQLLHGHALHVW